MKIDELVQPTEQIVFRTRYSGGQALLRGALVFLISGALISLLIWVLRASGTIGDSGRANGSFALLYFGVHVVLRLTHSGAILTNKRLLFQEGVFRTTVTEIDLANISKISRKPGVFGMGDGLFVGKSDGKVHDVGPVPRADHLWDALAILTNQPRPAPVSIQARSSYNLIMVVMIVGMLGIGLWISFEAFRLWYGPLDDSEADLTFMAVLMVFLFVGFPCGMMVGLFATGVVILTAMRLVLPFSRAREIICHDDGTPGNNWVIRFSRWLNDLAKRFLGFLYGRPIECD